jgi:hypothetical protein
MWASSFGKSRLSRPNPKENREAITISTLGDMAKAKARYSNDPKDKLIGCVFDPQGFKKPDGTLD